MKTKYDTDFYYDVLDNNFPRPRIYGKAKRHGWQSLSLKEFSNARVHESDRKKFNTIRSKFVPRLVKTEADCILALDSWRTTFRKTHLIESFRGKVLLLEKVQQGYALGFNRSMIIRLTDEVLGKMKTFEQCQKLGEKITHEFINEGSLSKKYGFEKELDLMYFKLLKRIFKTPDRFFDYFTTDRANLNVFYTSDSIYKFINSLLPIFIAENSDNFPTWYRLYSWDFATRKHQEQALKRMAYWAKNEEEFKKLIDIAPADSLIQRHALTGLHSIRGVASNVA